MAPGRAAPAPAKGAPLWRTWSAPVGAHFFKSGADNPTHSALLHHSSQIRSTSPEEPARKCLRRFALKCETIKWESIPV
ncbi:uncharacterized protein PGTG_04040 [Puccinia graminis f. sp. tritici CRL 75-36-700-3]|uniref:Uncharacterized protein n=1 Tax=Puccinia graminis f. sp. tritici (strain CRL 75-36-700-3 / race SCCL) TaxID=418459 RepID=E3K1A9_PUCGT|nr:uncharacterized protein PGTG_04040 [Puccinia graminis f. sp. tritici CRL 75-36-700-3]EFP78084.2 hypothetical protein PGTG_04040 [Puccinia graminis f. sp. tritici CRL 75-36-700-3]